MLHADQRAGVRSRIPQCEETQRRVFGPVRSCAQLLEYLASNPHTGFYADLGSDEADSEYSSARCPRRLTLVG